MHFVALVCGPNLNLLGKREPEIYGFQDLGAVTDLVRDHAESYEINIRDFQSNSEAEIISYVHKCKETVSGIIINPGALTHYSYALADALAFFSGPVVEIHISNIYARESWRHTSVVSPVANGTVSGFGIDGYLLAVDAMARLLGQ